jgi:hypothetical protein
MPIFGGEQLHMLHNRYETYIAYTNLPENSKIQEHVCYDNGLVSQLNSNIK